MGRGVWTPRSRVLFCWSGVSTGASRLRASRALSPPTGLGGGCPQPALCSPQGPSQRLRHLPHLLPISKSHSQQEREEARREEEAGGGRRQAGPAEGRARPLAGNVTRQPPQEAPGPPPALINSKLQ